MTPEEFLETWSARMSNGFKFDMKRELNAVIAAAVAAERERCAKVAEECDEDRRGYVAGEIASAIRALK